MKAGITQESHYNYTLKRLFTIAVIQRIFFTIKRNNTKKNVKAEEWDKRLKCIGENLN
jgi:hypothetical protein